MTIGNRRSLLAPLATAVALVGGLIVIPSTAPIAGAREVVQTTCPTGSDPVEFGFGIPPAPTAEISPQTSGLLCQSVFSADGTFTTPTGVTEVDVLVVGGGGGGGAGGVVGTQVLAGGGGGGGQVAVYEGVPVTGDIAVTVGVGGAGGFDLCDPTCHSGGDDGAAGESSAFGAGGTYVALGGSGGKGGASTIATPFLTSGEGGSSPSAPAPAPAPTAVTSTVSNGGAGSAPSGSLMGPAPEIFFSGGGGGAGAGGPGTAGELSDCVTVDSATSCFVAGGDGGIGLVPDTGLFDYFYWEYSFGYWSCMNLPTCVSANTTGFGPGGAGATSGLLLYSTDFSTVLVNYGYGKGTLLSGSEDACGQGAAVFAFNIEGTVPYVAPDGQNANNNSWDECEYFSAPGGGGGGGTGNRSVFPPDPMDPWPWNIHVGSNGTDGLVVVLFYVPVDNDGDGFFSDVDCDDDQPLVNPDATEVVGNGYDDDCNAETPINTDETLTCDFAPTSTVAVANDFLGLKFPAPVDVGSLATVGDNFLYTAVAAVGGANFATGSIDAVSGTGPWTVTLTVSDTTGIVVGDGVTAVNDVGALGDDSIATVSTVVDGSTLELTVTGSVEPVTGSVQGVRTGQLVDARVTVSDHESPDTLDINPVDLSELDPLDNANISTFLEALGGREGTVENIAGTGPWTADITGLADTDPFEVGDQIVQADFDDYIVPSPTGSIGSAGIYTITSVGADSLSYTAEGGAAPIAGTVGYVSTWSSVEYTIEFFETDTNTPIDLEDVAVTVKDIDEFQFLEVSRPDSFRLERATHLEVLTSADSDVVASNSYRFWSGTPSSSSDTPHWVEASYNSVSTLKLRIGALSAGTMFFAIAFRPETFDDALTCTTELTDTTPTTTTYTGDTGTFDPGDSLSLSATVDPDTCTTPAVTYELTYPDSTTATVTSPLDTTGFAAGTYTITAEYAGDGTCEASSDSAEFVIREQSSITYTGDIGVVLAGTPVTLSATVGPEACSAMSVDYQIVYPDGTVYDVSDPLDTTGLLSGIYEIIANTDPEDDTCLPSEDRAVLVVTSSADTVTGGGIYHVDNDISGTPRVHFGFTVQKTDKLDRRSGVRTITQRGQLLWINNNQWRLKASLYARWTDSTGIVSGDQPVFGTIPCPVGVGVSGSNPRCGVIVGEGWLERWNPDTLTWDIATDLGDAGWVRFGATVYDGGKVSICKGKRNCTIVDVADWFGMRMDDISEDDETGVPVTAPIEVRKQRNGAIVIRI